MKRNLVLLFVVIALIAAGGALAKAFAQITVGSDGAVTVGSSTAGAVLDLSQANGGLSLPQVTLTAENANPFGAGESVDLPDGLLVYNLGGAGNLDAGLYILQGGLWKPAGSGGGGGVPLVGVTITPSDPFNLSVGNTKQLDFSTYPPNATYLSMSWNSSDETVATVSNMGVVSAVAPGSASITLTLGSITSDPVTVTVVTCGAPFTAPSGKVYNTAAYSNANLTNLCWTTTNLQEAGQSATCYNNDCTTYPTRGYYYTVGSAAGKACAALNSGGTAWRVPTSTDWGYLKTAFSSLASGVGATGGTAALQAEWNSGPTIAGGYTIGGAWEYWGEWAWWAAGTPGVRFGSGRGSRSIESDGYDAVTWVNVRCVRSL